MIKQKGYKQLPRCPLPVIFLDTHIISNIAKWKAGKKLDKTALDRAKTLYETIHQLVRAKKVICPEIATWQDEYRLDSRIDEMCENVVVDLSQGITFTHPQGVEDSQVQLAMKAYVEQAGSVDYSKEWLLMYTRDPIEELRNKRPFVVRFNWAKNVETNEQIRERKKRLKEKLADIKRADAGRTPTFAEKLDEEYTGYIKGILRLGFRPVERYLKGEDITFEDSLCSLALGKHLVYWERTGGKPEGIKGLLPFYRSEYLRSVPSIEISAKLWAGLAVYLKGAKTKESDANDIKMIATIMPYADFLVLDKTMTDLARDRLTLGEKYNTKIYELSDLDALLVELQRIEKKESPLKELL